jgi:xanthine dehydrogenase YagR molybdenum-binding subunit
MTHAVIGKPLDRVDGPAKVRGAATYAAEHALQNVTHGVIVQSTVASGRVARLYTQQAEAAPGVLAVITPDNAGPLADVEPDFAAGLRAGERPAPLQGDRISYDGQHIAVVVADTLECAQAAARMVRATYDTESG